jgi:DNA-directed RNA polymerase III subunit RPC6
MLMEVTPSEEITGGPWFTDQELDVEFVDTLTKQCYKFILSKSLPRVNTLAIYPSSYSLYPTASQIQRFFADAQISTVELSVADIQCILDLLIYDGKVEKVTSHFSMGDMGDEEEVMYRAKRSRIRSNHLDAWSNVPCEKCPHLHVCGEKGPITPSKCDFMRRWLNDF